MRLQLRLLVAAVAMICGIAAGQSARAIDITFDLTQIANGQSTSSLTSSGYTLLFTSIGGTFNSSAIYDGLGVDQNKTFSISKTAGATDLIFKSYTMGYVFSFSGNTISFDLSGGTGTSAGNSFTIFATSNYNGSYRLVGSQTVTYSQVNFSSPGGPFDDRVYFHYLTFSTVPEPSTYALGAIATGVMAFVARRRKARRA